ncbi:hypothetical protein SLA2020_460270 [Shorea laevis]
MASDGYSFRTYSEADHELDEKAYRRQTLKRLIIIGLSTAVFIAVTISAVVGMVVPQKNTESCASKPITPNWWPPPPSTAASGQSIQDMCNTMTLYPSSCTSSMTSLLGLDNNSELKLDPKQFFILSIQVSLNELANISSLLSSKSYVGLESTDAVLHGALDGCRTLNKDAIGNIIKSFASVHMGQGKGVLYTDTVNDIRVWLRAAVADQKKCLDGLKRVVNRTGLFGYVGNVMRNSTEFTSNSLEIASKIIALLNDSQTPIHNRRLLRIDGGGGARILLEEKIHTSDLTTSR